MSSSGRELSPSGIEQGRRKPVSLPVGFAALLLGGSSGVHERRSPLQRVDLDVRKASPDLMRAMGAGRWQTADGTWQRSEKTGAWEVQLDTARSAESQGKSDGRRERWGERGGGMRRGGRERTRAAMRRVNAHVGNRIRQRRWTLGMTQKDLGHMVGMRFQQIHRYETGMARIGAAELDTRNNLPSSAAF